mmetsp:Transcript_31750/g.83883  ORF Transcript_31750/g.83883 Transcript_31750/m.83883 type:complete len:273 (-) Transcript_31750:910-1728(-)
MCCSRPRSCIRACCRSRSVLRSPLRRNELTGMPLDATKRDMVRAITWPGSSTDPRAALSASFAWVSYEPVVQLLLAAAVTFPNSVTSASMLSGTAWFSARPNKKLNATPVPYLDLAAEKSTATSVAVAISLSVSPADIGRAVGSRSLRSTPALAREEITTPKRTGYMWLYKASICCSAARPASVVGSTTIMRVYKLRESEWSCHDGYMSWRSCFGHFLYCASFSRLFTKLTAPLLPLTISMRTSSPAGGPPCPCCPSPSPDAPTSRMASAVR